ncbi:MAG: alpha-L-fucosidase [Akkermansia sp.]|nr:alpha-L-fucosidase [Akkermansia sp.]
MKIQHIITALLALASTAGAANPPAPCGAVPTEQQIQWQRLEFYAFIHFGLNTFTNKEWGEGGEDPSVFNPSDFDADEIVSAFKDAGMRGLIYTAKHHDGFCLWQTKSTGYNLSKSPWKNGKGDVARELANACKKHGLAFGVYISPWDRNNAEYGRPGYLDVYYKQIEELLSNYGDIFEIWFDGANGGKGYYGGTNEKRNIGRADSYYNFTQVVKNIRSLQPNCIIWGAEGRGDATWCGNEKGYVDYPYWCVAYRNEEEYTPNNPSGKIRWTLERSFPDKPTENELWLPYESDATMYNEQFFWHPNMEAQIKSPKTILEEIYLKSVGRGANLILNVPVNREGKLDRMMVDSLLDFNMAREKLLANDFALDAKCKASNVRGGDQENFGPQKLTDGDIESYWCTDDEVTTGEVEIELDGEKTFDFVRIREQIRLGQRVQNFAVDAWQNGQWVTIDAEESKGKSIGNQVIRPVPTTTTDRLRLRITKSRACPCISEFSLLKMPNAADYSLLEKAKRYCLSHKKRAKTIAVGAPLSLAILIGGIVWLRRRKSKRQA